MVNFIKRKFNKMVDARLIGLQDRIGFLDKRVVELEEIVEKLNTIASVEQMKKGFINPNIEKEWLFGAEKKKDGDS